MANDDLDVLIIARENHTALGRSLKTPTQRRTVLHWPILL